MPPRDETAPAWAAELCTQVEKATGEFRSVVVGNDALNRRLESVERGVGQVLAWTGVQDEKCRLLHRDVEEDLSRAERRLAKLEANGHTAALERASWLGGWRWLLAVAGVLGTLFGGAVVAAKLLLR